MNSKQYLEKAEELEMVMEQAASLAMELLGGPQENEMSAKIYFLMQEVKDLVEEIEEESGY